MSILVLCHMTLISIYIVIMILYGSFYFYTKENVWSCRNDFKTVLFFWKQRQTMSKVPVVSAQSRCLGHLYNAVKVQILDYLSTILASLSDLNHQQCLETHKLVPLEAGVFIRPTINRLDQDGLVDKEVGEQLLHPQHVLLISHDIYDIFCL